MIYAPYLIVGLEIICPFIQAVGVENRNLKKGTQKSDIQKANCLIFCWYFNEHLYSEKCLPESLN